MSVTKVGEITLEVLILDKFTYKIRQTIELPDYFEKIIFKDSKVKIICFGENVVEEKLK
ncbi:hypothetical protein [Chryseobacterium sp. SC28]|uniref:hypothetical protein n=1 Tax=Chryseobacterium sp. SC28 TaxID=2268028 RepID=UPI00162920AA|nr:hypothetical protein [Chryseobacterium sp. SC28]